MKILLVSFSNNYDHQLSLYSLYEELIKNGEDVYTCGIINPKVSFEFSNRNLLIKAPKRPGLTSSTLKTKPLKELKKFIKENNIDVIYFESLHVWNLFLLKKNIKAIKIHCLHDLIPHGGKNSFFISKLNNIIFKKSDCVVLRGKYSVDYCKLEKKYSKYDVRFLPLERKWNEFKPSKHTKRVLFFGRITEYKGVHHLYEIIEKSPNIQFDIVGRPLTKNDEMIVEKIRKLPNAFIENKYVSQEKMEDYLNNCDVVILPYLSSTQSGVIVDSYNSSRPCIAFDVGDIRNQIVDGQTGFLVEKNDVETFVNRINEFVSMPDADVDKMTLSAYNFGRDEFSSAVVAKKFLKLIKNVKRKNK